MTTCTNWICESSCSNFVFHILWEVCANLKKSCQDPLTLVLPSDPSPMSKVVVCICRWSVVGFFENWHLFLQLLTHFKCKKRSYILRSHLDIMIQQCLLGISSYHACSYKSHHLFGKKKERIQQLLASQHSNILLLPPENVQYTFACNSFTQLLQYHHENGKEEKG